MMKTRLLTVLAFAVLLFAACTNKDASQYSLMIPDDAPFVVHISGSSLSSKISWEEISESAWFREMANKSDDSLASELLKDPSNSGIDTKADLVVFSKTPGNRSYVVVAGTIADPGKFEKFISTLHKEEKAETKTENGFSYQASSQGAVIWNKSRFAFCGDNESGAFGGRPVRMGFNGEDVSPSSGYGPDSLKYFAEATLTPKSKGNLEADARYQELIKDGRDIHMWVNSGTLNSGMSNFSPIDLSGWLKGNVSAMSFNFDNGKITGKFKQYAGEEMKKLMEKHSAEPIPAALINRIPDTAALAVMAFSFPPAAIKDFLRATGADSFLEMGLGQQGFSVDDLIAATKGQMLLTLSNPGTATEPGSPMSTMKFLFATSVNDKKAFEKLVTSIWDTFKKMKGGDEEGGKAPELPFNYKIQDDWFALSNVAELTDGFLAGGSHPQQFADRLAGHPFGMYVDLQRIIRVFQRSGDPDGKFSEPLNTWQDVFVTGGNYANGASTAEMEINMVDKSTNSLKQLNRYLENMEKQKAARREAEKIELNSDEK